VIGGIVTRFAAGLRYPTLFKLVAALFVVDLIVPDMVPFMDEIMLALGTLLLAGLRKRREPPLEPDAGALEAARGRPGEPDSRETGGQP
jgi:hypothetical protein